VSGPMSEESEYDALVLPGVGALGDCIEGLRLTGMDRWVCDWINDERPFFGICLGFQALFDHSEEGNVSGLGVFPGCVRKFSIDPLLKVPHMGWNSVSFEQGADDLFRENLQDGDQFYFDHTYHVIPEDSSLAWGVTDYGGPFVSAIRRRNCLATQFHPEKSQAKGLQIYRNFLKHASCVITSKK